MRQFIIWRNRLSKFIDYPPAVIHFFKKRFYYNWIADSYLKYYKNVKFLDYQETIDILIDNNMSFVRFGDDVFDMLQGIGLYFGDWRQRYKPDLAMRLKVVLNSSNPKLLVGFNPELVFLTKKQFKEKGIPEQYQYWTNSKIYMKDYINIGQVYGRALCFQEKYNKNIDYQKIINYLRTKHLVIVTSRTDRFKNAKLGLTTDYVEGPGSDAWLQYDKILNDTKIVVSKYPKERVLVLSALGPTTKIITYDLTREGYTVWDTGQLFDLALQNLL